jgi:hypothetical protein
MARLPPQTRYARSSGAKIAYQVSGTGPPDLVMVPGLVLYGTSYRGLRAALLRRYRSVVRHWGNGRLVDLVAPSLAGPEARQAAGAFERAAASPAMAAALVESLGLMDVHDLMSALAVPVLVLHRDEDFIPAADARKVADQIPGATLKVLPGKDHLPWVGDWAAVIEEIRAFAGQVTPGAAGPGPQPGHPGAPLPLGADQRAAAKPHGQPREELKDCQCLHARHPLLSGERPGPWPPRAGGAGP